MTAAVDRALLIIGFSAGQLQLIDPVSKELSRLYNEEVRSITADTLIIFIFFDKSSYM